MIIIDWQCLDGDWPSGDGRGIQQQQKKWATPNTHGQGSELGQTGQTGIIFKCLALLLVGGLSSIISSLLILSSVVEGLDIRDVRVCLIGIFPISDSTGLEYTRVRQWPFYSSSRSSSPRGRQHSRIIVRQL